MGPVPWARWGRVAFTTAGLLGAGGTAGAHCHVGAPPSAALTQQLLTSPASLLSPAPDSIEVLRVAVRELAPTGPEALGSILSIVAPASRAQKAAIGDGLGYAAGVCLLQDPIVVQRIKDAVGSSGSRVVEQSFEAAFGDDAPPASASASGSAPGRVQPQQSLLPADPAQVWKLPDPFGDPNAWR